MKQNAYNLMSQRKIRTARVAFFFKTGSQIRAHSLGVLKLVTASCPAAAHIYMVIVIYVTRVIVKPSFARVKNFESSQRSRANLFLELDEDGVLPGVMSILWRHFMHTHIRRTRCTWSPSVGAKATEDLRLALGKSAIWITTLRKG